MGEKVEEEEVDDDEVAVNKEEEEEAEEEVAAALSLTASRLPLVSKRPAILFTRYFVYRNPHEHLDEPLIVSHAHRHAHTHIHTYIPSCCRLNSTATCPAFSPNYNVPFAPCLLSSTHRAPPPHHQHKPLFTALFFFFPFL